MISGSTEKFNDREADYLRILGLPGSATVALNLTVEALTEHAILKNEGVLTDRGVLMCDTGKFTGRSPKDKYIVLDDVTRDEVCWDHVNLPFDVDRFDVLHQRMLDSLQNKDVYVRNVKAGADKEYAIHVAVINTKAWHNMFCANLFIEIAPSEQASFTPDWIILNVPEFEAVPALDGTRQENFTIINFTKRIILIGGTGYAGEMKKGIFTVLNFILPQKNILPMHCSANIGADNDTALFFGLSGTGKTTLSTDSGRQLIGDDEHGWGNGKVFNFEGGCYAKVINLDEEHEPEIFGAIRPGAILENTRFFPDTVHVNYADNSVTENTRTAYPLRFIANRCESSTGTAPKNIFFLSADAFGVLPPLSRLTIQQAMYYFLSGYTAKLAGTEVGVKDPQPTFSACFGAAFLPMHATRYANLLGNYLEGESIRVWLVNTGWVGGSFGKGNRIKLSYTRALIRAALKGELDQVQYLKVSPFDLNIPITCPGVPDGVLNPETLWESKEEYHSTAGRLLQAFEENYQKFANIYSRES